MKRIVKKSDSLVISENLKYHSKGNNSRLSGILFKEQKGFCAYTEEYISFEDAKDIEHFDPNLKNTNDDNYNNWYIVKHLANQRKTNNWLEPILQPYQEDFEKRIIYNDGAYFSKPNDIEAKNLIDLLDLNNFQKVQLRKRYIKRRKDALLKRNIELDDIENIKQYFQEKIDGEIEESVRYLRAIQEEFNIDIWNMIPEQI
ncbi:hypothetical protein EG240_07780 [Paenimyroides tangerinum]|uniref:HNH nuclease domain-containing protein n=1 Tax=Paenimyroides tangerinum TaxID=2488728 RepID=A0A3P3WA98_9FLAO|nr:HNH endonuclease domain-containing protein [Paenimyroides tangerinum]RRJ90916.1 hypothetical protein EG240_07780 [Paenimyroides tangerinum]